MMDLTIKCLDLNDIDKIIDQDADTYARIVRKETTYDLTVDILITVEFVAIDESRIFICYPNKCYRLLDIPSNHYHKIELL